MSYSELLATATLEKRKTDLGTSPRVVRLIPRRAGSISSLYGAKTNLKAKKNSVCNLKRKVPHNKRPKPTIWLLDSFELVKRLVIRDKN